MVKRNSEMMNTQNDHSSGKLQRRSFLQLTGALVLTAGAAACKKTGELSGGPQLNDGSTLDFKDDTGIVNFIYALEQLEAEFYIKVNEAYPTAFSTTQISFFKDIRLHEIAHREFYKSFLGAAGIGKLEFDLSSVNFTDASAVLTTAKTFEDLGVAAYNGALMRAQQSYTLTILSQVSSVEARHAAWLRGQIVANDFADLNDLSYLGADATNGLDAVLAPDKVLAQAAKYIKTQLKVINL